MQINADAPAVAIGETHIAASPETVWQVLTNIEGWPSWNPDVKDASLAGDLSVGSVFRWKAGPGKITSTLQQVEPPNLIGWTGKTFGIQAIHLWRLQPDNGGTLAHSEESWEGFPVRILSGRMQKMLQEAIDNGLQYLKAEAERRAVGSPMSSNDKA